MGRVAPTRLAVVVLACVAAANAGCTLVGAAIGANVPRYETSDWPRSKPSHGDPVRVGIQTTGSDAPTLARVEGAYDGVRDGALVVMQDDGRAREIPLRDVGEVQVHGGSEWRSGLLIGALTDACILAAVIAATSSSQTSLPPESFR